ncbi:MAG: hypothetical protein AAF222_05290, partial [Pseudomonadota bacterium]
RRDALCLSAGGARAADTCSPTCTGGGGAPFVAPRDWLADRHLTKAKITWKEDVRHWHPGQDWIWEPGGLGVFDPGINALSVLTAILPHAVHVSDAALHFPTNRDTPIAADLTFHDPTGAEVTAAFDWLEQGPPRWMIEIETHDGHAKLSEGGARFTPANGDEVAGKDEEYRRLYDRFAKLIARAESDVDLSPMRHVADAFTLGRRVAAPAFDW